MSSSMCSEVLQQMAVPEEEEEEEEEKATVRCLDVARYIVAATVTALIVAVIACASTGALRPPEVAFWVVGGSVWVRRNGSTNPFNASIDGDKLTFEYSTRALNPSGSVRINFTDFVARLRARNSSGGENSFLVLHIPDLTLAPQKTEDTYYRITTFVKVPSQEEYFKTLGDGRSIDAWLVFNGNRIVENKSGHNTTPEVVVYSCSPIVVTRDDDGKYADGTAPLDALCTYST